MSNFDFRKMVKDAGMDIDLPVENVLTGDVGFLKGTNGPFDCHFIFIPLDKFGIPKTPSYKNVTRRWDEEYIVKTLQLNFRQYTGDLWKSDVLLDKDVSFERGTYFPEIDHFSCPIMAACNVYNGKKKIKVIQATLTGKKVELEDCLVAIQEKYSFCFERDPRFCYHSTTADGEKYELVLMLNERKFKKFLGQVSA